MSRTTLYHFCGSHYNEKARWALDWKAAPHDRRWLWPGPHIPTVKKLSGGTEVPVLQVGDDVIAGSAAIIDHLERTIPDPPLYPDDPVLRGRALEIQRKFDETVGAPARLALFHDVMDGEFASRAFGAEASPTSRFLYRASFAPIHAVIRKQLAITPERADAGRETIREALDFVVKEAGPDGYLVGDRFTVADLTCASLLLLAVEVEDVGGPAMPKTKRVVEWLARFADHPGAAWVRETYRRHRRPQA